MNRPGLTVALMLLGAVALVSYLTLFTVDQTQQALVAANKAKSLLSWEDRARYD